VERHHEEIVRAGEPAERVGRAADLARAGQEDEHVAVEARRGETPHGRGDLRLERAVVAMARVLDRDLVRTALLRTRAQPGR
jgi:hypothetical protein